MDDAVFLRIEEQLFVCLRIFHIGPLCRCVKDTGEYAPLIHLTVIALSSFLDLGIPAHFCVECIYHDAVSVREVSEKLLVDSGDDLIKRTDPVFLSACAFWLSQLSGTWCCFQFNCSFVGFFQAVVFQLYTIVEVKRLCLVRRELFGKVRAENVFLIPPKENRADPWPCDFHTYKERNLVKCFFNKLKFFRRVAARYDKLAVSFVASFHLTSIFALLK